MSWTEQVPPYPHLSKDEAIKNWARTQVADKLNMQLLLENVELRELIADLYYCCCLVLPNPNDMQPVLSRARKTLGIEVDE